MAILNNTIFLLFVFSKIWEICSRFGKMVEADQCPEKGVFFSDLEEARGYFNSSEKVYQGFTCVRMIQYE